MQMINEENYVDKAEEVIKKLAAASTKGGKAQLVTTSKIRNLLSMTADIYNQIINQASDILSKEVCGRIEYLRVRVIYECGREPKVRDLVEEAKILNILKEIRGSKKNFLLFSRYMEALVAFRKYYGEKE